MARLCIVGRVAAMTWLRDFKARISAGMWVAAYTLEDSRESHATHGRYLRSAACCVGLAVLSILGGHA